MRHAIHLCLFLALGVGIGLLAEPARAQQGCPPASASADLRLIIEPAADNSLLARATVDTAAAVPVFVEYGNEQAGWMRTPTSPAGTRHELALVRLRAAASYQVRAFALDAAGCPTAFAASELSTGLLPPEFRKLAIQATGRSSYPLTLMDLRLTDDDLRWLVIFDQQWQPVWYYQIPPEILQFAPGQGANSVIRLSDGNLLYLARNWGLEEIDPRRARAVRRLHLPGSEIHHDLYELPDGRVLFLGAEVRTIDDSANGGPPDLPLRGDNLNLLDLTTSNVERVWSVFDTHDLSQRSALWRARREEKAEEWTHANSIALGARGNVLVSLRFLDQVLSFSPDLKTIEWRLGGPDSSFTFRDPSALFYGQHSVTEVSEGHLLMFDNGNFRPDGEYSRALELELDFGTMTARKVWEYRRQPSVYSYSQSSALRLANGNTLVNFGFRDEPTEPVLLVEARPDGTPAWEMTIGLKGQRITRYRAYPLATVSGEMSVEPTRTDRL